MTQYLLTRKRIQKGRTSHDESWRDFAGPIDDGRLGAVHVESAHVAQLLEESRTDKPLGGECAHRAVVTRRADHDRGSNDVRVHARLRVVVERDERPVRHDTRNALLALEVLANDQVLDGRRIHEHDIRHRQDTRKNGGREERGVFDHDECTLVFERNADFREETVCWLADNLGFEVS